MFTELKGSAPCCKSAGKYRSYSKILLDPFIIAVDACLGNAERVGFINIKPGGLLPGSALQKSLPYVGDFHISGVVNVAGCFDHLVLQNTRLFLVDGWRLSLQKACIWLTIVLFRPILND
jgi:putative sporulation protein YyaC